MKPWVELYRQHGALRSMKDEEAANEVRVVLRRLSEKPHPILRHGAPSRFNKATIPHSASVTYTLGRDRAGEPLTLRALPEIVRAEVALKHATLTVLLRFDRREHHLQELAVMLSGARHDDSPWALAVHLPHDARTPAHPRGDRDGLGACGHAALHCHIGPTLDMKPKVRVPFPALRPAQILEWAVAQVVPAPTFEPAPWSGVDAMLRPS